MSTEQNTVEEPQPTKPLPEHAWLHNFVGDWVTESTISAGPDAPPEVLPGQEKAEMFGDLWVCAEGSGEMPGGHGRSRYKMGLGYDVSFKEYRGYFVTDMSSHHWKYVGELSEDGKTMTLTCEGPDMVKDGETAMYKDIHHLIDENHRKMTSEFQDPEGNWVEFQVVSYTRK